MPIISIILIFFILLILISRKTIDEKFIYVLSISILFEIFVSVGYFIKIGTFEISNTEFLYIFSILLIFFKNSKFNKNKLVIGVLLIISMLLSIISQLIFPYNEMVIPESHAWDLYYFYGKIYGKLVIGLSQIKEILHTLCYVIIISNFFCLQTNQKKLLIHNMYKLSKIFIFIFLMEFIFVIVLNKQQNYYNVLKFLFGNSYFSDSAVTSIGVSHRLRGLKSEPSMFGYSLFLITLLYIYLLINKLENKKALLLCIISTIFLMVFSLSFSAIICALLLAIFIILYAYEKASRKNKGKILISVFLFLFIGLCVTFAMFNYSKSNYYIIRIKMAILSITNINMEWKDEYNVYDASTLIRIISMLGSLKYYFENLFFGISMGSTYSHSTLATILASIGTIGFLLWVKLTFFSNNQHKNTISYTIVIIIWLVALLILGNGLFPFYGLQNILLIIFFDMYSKKSNFMIRGSV